MNLVGDEIWQWDLDRRLAVGVPATQVHYSRRGDRVGYMVDIDDDGYADIPNILLQRACTIYVYAYDGTRTVDAGTITVGARAKPDTYVYSETDVTTVEEVIDDYLDENLPEIITEALASGIYMPLSDAQVEDAWEGNGTGEGIDAEETD